MKKTLTYVHSLLIILLIVQQVIYVCPYLHIDSHHTQSNLFSRFFYKRNFKGWLMTGYSKCCYNKIHTIKLSWQNFRPCIIQLQHYSVRLELYCIIIKFQSVLKLSPFQLQILLLHQPQNLSKTHYTKQKFARGKKVRK